MASHNAAPLLQREPHHHHALAVGADEVAPEGAEELVAVALARLAELRLRDEAEVAHHGQRHVLQRELHVLAFAGAAAMPLGREQARGHHLSGHEVPRGQHVVHRLGRVARAR